MIETRLAYPPLRVEYQRRTRRPSYPDAPGQAYHLRPHEREPERVVKGR